MTYGRGRLDGVHAEPGTLLGPNDYGELLAVDANDEVGCTVRLATTHDLDAAGLAVKPRSVTEHQLRWRPSPDVSRPSP